MFEFGVLGPLEVVSDGMPVKLGRGMARPLLVVLVLSAGRPVSSDELIAALWSDRAPATAPEMLRNAVARLRARLGPGVIETTAAGYRLVADDEDIDLRRFQRLAQAGSDALADADYERSASTLRAALGLWRGRPLPELDDAAAFVPIVSALEEQRLHAEGDRIEAELALGRAAALVHELEELNDQHPYRERLLGQLMLALYRSGRQKDALDRYAAGRRRLVDEVGLEPGPDLQDLQLRILRQDPALRDTPPVRPAGGPLTRNRRAAIAAGAIVVLAAAAVVAAAAWPDHASPRIPSRGLVELGGDGKPKTAAPLALRPGVLAADGDHVWVASSATPVVVAVDRKDLSRRGMARIRATAFSLVAAGGSAWVGNGFNGTVSRIDAQGRVSTFRPEPRAEGRLPLAAAGTSLWVASQDGVLTRFDAKSTRRLATYTGVGEANAIAADDAHVWLAAAKADVVKLFEPRVGRVVERIPIGGRPTYVAIGDGAVWVLTPEAGTAWRIDPRRRAVVGSVPVPRTASAIATTPKGGLWVAAGSTLILVDAATNSITGTQSVGRRIDGITAFRDRLWVTVG